MEENGVTPLLFVVIQWASVLYQKNVKGSDKNTHAFTLTPFLLKSIWGKPPLTHI